MDLERGKGNYYLGKEKTGEGQSNVQPKTQLTSAINILLGNIIFPDLPMKTNRKLFQNVYKFQVRLKNSN
jgi:hypothetical protein